MIALAAPTLVQHRIGGLEMQLSIEVFYFFVQHRIGGLEKNALKIELDQGVNHRIGGLEALREIPQRTKVS